MGSAFEKLADHHIRDLLDTESFDLDSAKLDMKILLRYLEWKNEKPGVVKLLQKRLEEIDSKLEAEEKRRRTHWRGGIPDIIQQEDSDSENYEPLRLSPLSSRGRRT